MPGSIRENDRDVLEFVIENGIKTILDVGAGKGTYCRILHRVHGVTIDAVEIWEPYIDHYALRSRYREVFVTDARDLPPEAFAYDLVIFGDVLEHLSRPDALALWKQAAKSAAFGLISVPIIHYPQGEEWGNPYEVHQQEHLTPEQVREDYGPFYREWLYEVTGTFVAKF